MKKSSALIITIIFIGSQLLSQANSYTSFEWDIVRIGYVDPFSNDQLKSGTSFASEVRYNLSDNSSIGLGFEGAVFNAFSNEEELDVDVSGLTSISYDRYLSNKSSTRGFYGLGVGYYSNGEIRNINSSTEQVIDGPSSFGVSPRFGYELGHVRVMGQYHYTFKETTANYFNLTVAVTIWGGMKN